MTAGILHKQLLSENRSARLSKADYVPSASIRLIRLPLAAEFSPDNTTPVPMEGGRV